MSLWAFVLLLGIGCTAVDTPQAGWSEPAELPPDQEGWGKTIEVTEGGRRRAVVTAGHFRKYDSSRKAELDEGITVLFFNPSGRKQVSNLTAQQAEIDEKTGDMEVSGSVVLVGEDSTRLETERLRWNRKSEKITGEDRVTIRRSEGVETGIGFEATSDLKHWTLREVVTRFGRPDSSEKE